jgi:carbamoyl-phosphate synthase large subunit
MPLNVLITAGSRRVPLVEAFRRAVGATGGGQVFVSDVNAMSPAVHVADAAFRVPLATESGYIDAIEEICREECVGLVVPTIDDELEILGGARERFESQGIRLATSDMVTARICNDKLATSKHLRSRGVAAADAWLPTDVPRSVAFPLFVKPRHGRGGVAAYPVCNARQLAFFSDYVERPVVQEYLDGPEFTIDMLCDHGRPLAIVPRERVVIRAGVMDRGRTVRDGALIELGEACADALAFHGAVNIQCRTVAGVPTVFEINPRFSGGIPLTIAAGADFPRMLVDLALGRPVAPRIGRFTDGLWMTCFESGIFLTADHAEALTAPDERSSRVRRVPDVQEVA